MIKDIAVQLTGSSEDEVRLSYAGAVAKAHEAHLIGVHLHTLPDILDLADPVRSSYVRSLLEDSNRSADEAFAKLETTFSQLECTHELRRVHGLAADAGTQLAAIARTVDLFVGTRPYGDIGNRHRIEEAVLFGSGRGCLLLPPGGRPRHTFDTIFVTFDGSRAAARALAEAMPLMVRSSKVVLGTIIDPGADESAISAGTASMIAHLRRHGLDPSAIQQPFRTDTGEQLEALAHQQGADLIVCGAYGHAKFVEWVFGGVTSHLLRYSTLPLLMAH